MSNRVASEMSGYRPVRECLTAEKKNSGGSFFQVTQEWLDRADGTFDLMNAFKKICTLLGHGFYQTQAESFLDAAAVPRLPSVTISMVQRLNSARFEKKTIPVVADASHQVFDVGATACYAWAFFKQQPQSVLKAASVFDVLSDGTDVVTNVHRWWDFQKKQVQAKSAPQLIQQAILNEKRDAVLNLIRAVSAVAASIFACFLVLTGASLVPMTAAVTIAIASSIFTILAYYHKNYWCNVQLKIN